MNQDHQPQEAPQTAEPEPAKETQGSPRLARARPAADPNRSPVPAGLDDLADEVFEQGLVATDTRWSNAAKEFLVIPDIKTRLETLKLYLSYRHGMPIQRQIRIEAGFKDRQTEMIEIARTPSGRELLLKMGVIDAGWLKEHVPDSNS
jgi:hypothetical protein